MERSLDGNCKSPTCTTVGVDGKTKGEYRGPNSEARSTKDAPRTKMLALGYHQVNHN